MDTPKIFEREYRFCLNAVQPDGSYGESLQYSNYCFRGLMLTYEALLRSGRDPGDMPYAKAVRWFRHSLLYNKPLSGWGEHPRPRSLNFNDSAALFGPDPDLLIRTSGEIRLSNYLLWQLAYSEIYITDCLWPDFNQEELEKAIVQYNKRERRFGGVKA